LGRVFAPLSRRGLWRWAFVMVFGAAIVVSSWALTAGRVQLPLSGLDAEALMAAEPDHRRSDTEADPAKTGQLGPSAVEGIPVGFGAVMLAEYALAFAALWLHPALALVYGIVTSVLLVGSLPFVGSETDATPRLVLTLALEMLGLLSFAALALWLALRRLSDRERSPFWILVTLIPFVGALWWLLDLGLGSSRSAARSDGDVATTHEPRAAR